MKEICVWLKQHVKLAVTPSKEFPETPDKKPTNLAGTPASCRPTRRYDVDTVTPSSERKRKISWEDILHPLKSRRLEREGKRPLDVVRGNFSLKDIRGAKFPGCQTAATSLCAILQSKALAPSSWSAEVIDRLLLQGDKLHSTRVVHLQKDKTDYVDLMPEELPDHIAVGQKEYSLRFRKVSTQAMVRKESGDKRRGALYSKSRSERLSKTLKPWMFTRHAGIMVTVKKETMAVFSDASYCYLFHPCKPCNGLFYGNDYEAVLSKFRSADHLSMYLCQKLVKEESPLSMSVVYDGVDFDIWTQFSFAVQMPWV